MIRAAVADGTAPAARVSPGASRLPLLLLPTLLFTALLCVAGLSAFEPEHGWLRFALPPLLLLSAFRLSLTASGPLLGCCARAPAPPAADPVPPAAGRGGTAILMPIFNEPPGPVARALQVMAESLGPEDDVAFFVLSDTQDPARAAVEARFFPEAAISRSGIRVSYRRRSPNSGRKAGNIARFCSDHGHNFAHAIVLDADSLMTADAIRALIRAMRRDPAAALIQTVSFPIGGATLFARVQQFGARLGTDLAVRGQDLWQHRRGTYWGHNAILRLAPFMAHAELPVLPGRAPLGGEILCHDTIEAALLLRAGWDVRLDNAIEGSFETTPSNLVDFLARERRWCQGNLQHLRLLLAPGLRPASRLHIGMGILYYLATPIGLLATLALLAAALLPRHAPSPPAALRVCFWLTLFLLFAPRLLSAARVLCRPGLARRGFGGASRLLLGLLLEQGIGTLLAPVLTVSVTGFVIDTLRGRAVGWTSAARGNRSVGWREAARLFGPHTAIGVLTLAAIRLLRPELLPWSLPFLAGLLLSIPLVRALGSVRLGRLARRTGLFCTVDELAPLPEQRALMDAGPSPVPSPVATAATGFLPPPRTDGARAPAATS